jgi:hypothetical protein
MNGSTANEAYFAKILGIEKNRPNPRKDYAKFSDIAPLTRFFYYEEWERSSKRACRLIRSSRKKISPIC